MRTHNPVHEFPLSPRVMQTGDRATGKDWMTQAHTITVRPTNRRVTDSTGDIASRNADAPKRRPARPYRPTNHGQATRAGAVAAQRRREAAARTAETARRDRDARVAAILANLGR